MELKNKSAQPLSASQAAAEALRGFPPGGGWHGRCFAGMCRPGQHFDYC
jgi:hypothetical protein